MSIHPGESKNDDLDVPACIIHLGLLVFGLLSFFWMALTGSLMFFFLETGLEAEGIIHFVEEIHEIGEGLIPVFLHNFNQLTWCDRE